jgi:hypothetical protein
MICFTAKVAGQAAFAFYVKYFAAAFFPVQERQIVGF